VFERFGELHFLPTFKAWSVRLCIAIVKSDTSRLFGYLAVNLMFTLLGVSILSYRTTALSQYFRNTNIVPGLSLSV